MSFPPLHRAPILGLADLLFACATPRQNENAGQADGGLQVVTTFLPITLFTRAVAGERATVTDLIPPSNGPHNH